MTQPLRERLVAAHRDEWDGQLVVRSGADPHGVVVLHQGRVAWAVCRRQPETLGRFLRRLGRVTRTQLDEVQRRYDQSGGRQKIGELLENAGMIRRPVLRRCLLLHTRLALECLCHANDTEVSAHDGRLQVDEEMTFSLEELMPMESFDVTNQEPPATRWRTWNRENRCLERLSDIAGYQAASLVKADGEVVAAHTSDRSLDMSVLGVYLAAVLESASRAAGSMALGQVQFALLDCTAGSLVACWVDDARTHLAVVLVAEDGQIGAAKYGLRNALSALSETLGT